MKIPSPGRPKVIPNRLSLSYYPFLKVQQYLAAKRTVHMLERLVKQHSIKNLLAIPVTPWILSAAVALHKSYPQLKLILFVMDDWQGHHESHRLPYSARRRRLLREAVERSSTRFAVSKEMARHYEDLYGNTWSVAHNGIRKESIQVSRNHSASKKSVLLAGDINEFRFDAVMAFAEAIERHNQSNGNLLNFVVLGEVAEKHRNPLAALPSVSLPGRRRHDACLDAMQDADLLYLPLAFSKAATRISRYSLPTKLPEYLATGKTVFFHAPFDSALFQVAERYDLHPRLATTDPLALDALIESWQTVEQDVENQLLKARTALTTEFDLSNLTKVFQASFN